MKTKYQIDINEWVYTVIASFNGTVSRSLSRITVDTIVNYLSSYRLASSVGRAVGQSLDSKVVGTQDRNPLTLNFFSFSLLNIFFRVSVFFSIFFF